MAHGDGLDAGQCGLRRGFLWAEKSGGPRSPRGLRGYQSPRDGAHAAVQGELSESRMFSEPLGGNLARSREHG